MSDLTKDQIGHDEKIISPSKMLILKFKANKLAMFGLIAFIIIVVIVVVSQLYIRITGYNLGDISRIGTHKNLPPSFENFFGTDKYGRDYFLRVLAGGWISLQVGILATIISVTIGIIIGSIAGFFGGKVDMALMRFAEVVSAFPFLAASITISVIFIDAPETEKLFFMIFVLGILRWTGLARMVRGQILSLREQEFMIASKALGIKTRNQICRHLIPNVMAYVIVSATITFAVAIILEAALSFLGLSISEPVPTWGGLLQRASTSSIMKNQWWLWISPGFLLFSLIMSVNLIGEGLRDAVDPKSGYHEKDKKSIFSRLFKVKRGVKQCQK